MSTATKAPRKAPAPGPGKQKKVFPESNGVSHLLQLSEAITGAKSETLEKKVEHNKLKVKARQIKKQHDNESKKQKLTARKADTRLQSKADIRAALKAQKREKSRARKDARKQRSSQAQSAPQQQTKPRKSVAFNLS